jgi:hypothetical protein
MADATIDVHDQMPRHDLVYDRFIETRSWRSLVTDLLRPPLSRPKGYRKRGRGAHFGIRGQLCSWSRQHMA